MTSVSAHAYDSVIGEDDSSYRSEKSSHVVS